MTRETSAQASERKAVERLIVVWISGVLYIRSTPVTKESIERLSRSAVVISAIKDVLSGEMADTLLRDVAGRIDENVEITYDKDKETFVVTRLDALSEVFIMS